MMSRTLCDESPFSPADIHSVSQQNSILMSSSELLGWRSLMVVERSIPTGSSARMPAVNAHMIVLQLAGTAEVEFVVGELRGRKLTFPGQLSIVPGGTIVETRSDSNAALCIVYLRASIVNAVIEQSPRTQGAHLLPKFSFIDPVLSGLVSGCSSAMLWNAIDSQSYIDHFAWAIAAHVVENYSSLPIEKSRNKGGTLTNKSLLTLENYIRTHIAHRIGVRDLARAAGYNPDYFSRIFHKTLGISPYRYLMKTRMDAVRDALRTEARLADIAMATGFCNQEHMTRTFRQFHRISPSQYRRQLQIL